MEKIELDSSYYRILVMSIKLMLSIFRLFKKRDPITIEIMVVISFCSSVLGPFINQYRKSNLALRTVYDRPGPITLNGNIQMLMSFVIISNYKKNW